MSHIYRAYYAVQGLTNRAGLPTNAVYGFTNMLRKLVADEKPQYLGVAIDLTGPTVRHERYKAYKATRRPMPDDLKLQIPYIKKVCEVLKVPILSHQKYEADDVIGTLSQIAVKRGLDVVIVTIDKDMFQLVNDHVAVLDTRAMLRLDAAGVEEKFGVPPSRVVDVLALVGDTSDNIPGAPGIGEKGARQLIAEFGGLQQLLERCGEVSRKTYRESLQNHEDQIRQSLDLVRIHLDLPIELNLGELRLSEPDRDAARELFTELEFVSLLEEFLPEPGAASAEVEATPIEDARQLRALASDLKGKTAALAFQVAGGVQATAISVEPGRAWVVNGAALENLGAAAVVETMAGAAAWVVHDLKPLYSVPMGGAVWPDSLGDTMLMAYLLSPNHNDFSLEKLALEYLQRRLETADKADGLFAGQDLPLAERAEVTLRLHERFAPQIEAFGMTPLLEQIEIPLVEALAEMERVGVKVDTALLAAMSIGMESEIEGLTERIFKLAGEEFNINSPKQLADVLFEKLQLPVPKKTRKAGHYATGVEVLETLGLDHEIARLILEYREASKLKSTYLDALPKLVDPKTGRVHTSYNQMVAATGRLSSSNPNLQNIPIKTEQGRKIRKAFVAEEGFQILAADYSQIELRVMAHLSQDPVLLDAFKKGEDIHERTAREVFGMNAVMNPREFRRHAKVINFGIIYGLSAFGLAQSLKIDRRQAQQFIESYFQRYAGVKAWIDSTIHEVHRTGYVTTLFGRIRQIPEVRSRNWNLRGFGERTAINAPIQGTAADLIKKAMVSIHRRLKREGRRSRLIMQVHDELVFEVASPELDQMKRLVIEEMEGAARLSVPLKIDLACGASWFDAK